jgi:hypothetical protein
MKKWKRLKNDYDSNILLLIPKNFVFDGSKKNLRILQLECNRNSFH